MGVPPPGGEDWTMASLHHRKNFLKSSTDSILVRLIIFWICCPQNVMQTPRTEVHRQRLSVPFPKFLVFFLSSGVNEPYTQFMKWWLSFACFFCLIAPLNLYKVYVKCFTVSHVGSNSWRVFPSPRSSLTLKFRHCSARGDSFTREYSYCSGRAQTVSWLDKKIGGLPKSVGFSTLNSQWTKLWKPCICHWI